jgi:hypothetical protein
MYICIYVCMYGGYLRRGSVGQRVGSEQGERGLSIESTVLVYCRHLYVCMYTCIFLGGMRMYCMYVCKYVCTAHP